jgi:hypothetical protein
MRTTLLLCLFCLGTQLLAQTTADFENFGLTPGTFINNASSGTFNSGNVSLPNEYNPVYDAWSGWAISAATDIETMGFSNQYAAVAGRGANGSDTYALTYVFGGSPMVLTGAAAGTPVQGMYVTNTTYAYFSMLFGDSFAKQFGGETGDDPDFFLLTIKGFLQGEEKADSVNFYLADYRFSDNSQDYIVADWTYLELGRLGNVDRLVFNLSSSDNGAFGMNTPAYVCVDDVQTSDTPVRVREQALQWTPAVFPNPASDQVWVRWPSAEPGLGLLRNAQGQLLQQYQLLAGDNLLDISQLPAGLYTLDYHQNGLRGVVRMVKQ